MKLKKYRSVIIIGVEFIALIIMGAMFALNTLRDNKMDALVASSDKGTKNYIKRLNCIGLNYLLILVRSMVVILRDIKVLK